MNFAKKRSFTFHPSPSTLHPSPPTLHPSSFPLNSLVLQKEQEFGTVEDLLVLLCFVSCMDYAYAVTELGVHSQRHFYLSFFCSFFRFFLLSSLLQEHLDTKCSFQGHNSLQRQWTNVVFTYHDAVKCLSTQKQSTYDQVTRSDATTIELLSVVFRCINICWAIFLLQLRSSSI